MKEGKRLQPIYNIYREKEPTGLFQKLAVGVVTVMLFLMRRTIASTASFRNSL